MANIQLCTDKCTDVFIYRHLHYIQDHTYVHTYILSYMYTQVCERFKTTFPIYDKVKVKGAGPETEPLFVYLKANSSVMMSKEIW